MRPTSTRCETYYVSALVRSGRSIKEVQQLARHAKPETTLKHYAKVSVHDLNIAVQSLGACNKANHVGCYRDGFRRYRKRYRSDRAYGCNSNGGNDVASNDNRFAKPLNWETGFGGSNPPLSVLDTSESSRSGGLISPRQESDQSGFALGRQALELGRSETATFTLLSISRIGGQSWKRNKSPFLRTVEPLRPCFSG